jgi:hypothetical protein
MGSFEHTHLVTTAQYLKATENPSAIAPRDIRRSGASGFIEIRQGLQGWAALARLDYLDPDRSLAANAQRRVIAGGAVLVRLATHQPCRPRRHQRTGALRQRCRSC